VSISSDSLNSEKNIEYYFNGNKLYKEIGALSLDDICTVISYFESSNLSIYDIFVNVKDNKYSIKNPDYFKDFVGKVVKFDSQLVGNKRLTSTSHYKALFGLIKKMDSYQQVVKNLNVSINVDKQYKIASENKSHISELSFV
jgi:hypothetical protein